MLGSESWLPGDKSVGQLCAGPTGVGLKVGWTVRAGPTDTGSVGDGLTGVGPVRAGTFGPTDVGLKLWAGGWN